jgi:hypothetical protein
MFGPIARTDARFDIARFQAGRNLRDTLHVARLQPS